MQINRAEEIEIVVRIKLSFNSSNEKTLSDSENKKGSYKNMKSEITQNRYTKKSAPCQEWEILLFKQKSIHIY